MLASDCNSGASIDVVALRRRIPELVEVLVTAAGSGLPDGLPDWQIAAVTAQLRQIIPLILPSALSKLGSGRLLSERKIELVIPEGAGPVNPLLL